MIKMICKYKANETFKHILYLTLVYFLAHFFLLIATGRWWDDWVYANKNWDYLLEVFMQSSLPFHAYIDASLWLFPDGFDRVLTFLFFYLGGIFIYLILKKINFFKKNACFWITILYYVIPINDARITWICYGYGLGLFLFWISFYLATIWKQKYNNKVSFIRILSLLILFISYDTESIMLMTSLILAYFYYIDLYKNWRWIEWKKNIFNFFQSVLKHIDYLLAPIIWYILSKLLFPGYGVYGGHSYVTWGSLPQIIFSFPLNALSTLKNIFLNYFVLLTNDKNLLFIICVLFLYFIISFINTRKRPVYICEKVSYSYNLKMIILGAIIFSIGFFPYAVKRNTEIQAIYTQGRDTLLLGLGVAILIYYSVNLFFNYKMRQPIIIVILLLGILHFNYTYLDWQQCYYQQLQLQDEITNNDKILNGNTFLVMFKGGIICNAFYQTNGNSWAVTGEETRYFMSGIEEIDILKKMNKNTWCLNAYGMKEYDYNDKIIDGIIFVDYEKIPRITIFKQKMNELFNKERFNCWIHEIKKIQYVSITPKESNKIIQLYSDKKLTTTMVYNMYYKN